MRLRPIELQPRLDQPNRIRRRRRRYPSANGSLGMNECGIFVVQHISPDPLAVPIHVELDRSRRHHARKTWPKASEKRRPALYPVDGADDLKRAGPWGGEGDGERSIGDSVDI